MIRFEIKPEVVEWLGQEWVREPEMAQELIEGLMGMMIAYGCISINDDDPPDPQLPPHLSFKAETLTRRIDGDMTYYKVKGGKFAQYGVTIWPETLQAAGFDLNTLAMVTSLTGYTAYYVLQGKTAKVVELARG